MVQQQKEPNFCKAFEIKKKKVFLEGGINWNVKFSSMVLHNKVKS